MIGHNHYKQFLCLAVQTSLETIKSLFRDREQYEIYYTHEGKKETYLEIRFDRATLTCLFDNKNVCEGVFLLPDDITDIGHYMEDCNKTYPYCRTLKGWRNGNFLIQINIDYKDSSLSILPIKSI